MRRSFIIGSLGALKKDELSWSYLVLMVEGIHIVKSIQKNVIYYLKNSFLNGIRVMNAYLCDKETALENLSKEDLIKVVSSRDEEIDYLKSQLAMYKRMQFGQSRGRLEGDPNQTMLPEYHPD